MRCFNQLRCEATGVGRRTITVPTFIVIYFIYIILVLCKVTAGRHAFYFVSVQITKKEEIAVTNKASCWVETKARRTEYGR